MDSNEELERVIKVVDLTFLPYFVPNSFLQPPFLPSCVYRIRFPFFSAPLATYSFWRIPATKGPTGPTPRRRRDVGPVQEAAISSIPSCFLELFQLLNKISRATALSGPLISSVLLCLMDFVAKIPKMWEVSREPMGPLHRAQRNRGGRRCVGGEPLSAFCVTCFVSWTMAWRVNSWHFNGCPFSACRKPTFFYWILFDFVRLHRFFFFFFCYFTVLNWKPIRNKLFKKLDLKYFF